MVACDHWGYESTWIGAGVTEQLNFKFYLILINLNVISHIWLVTTILDSTILVIIDGAIVFKLFCSQKNLEKKVFLKFWFYFSVPINVLKCVCLHDRHLTKQAFVLWHCPLWYFSPKLLAAERLLHLVGATEQCTIKGFGMTERPFSKKKWLWKGIWDRRSSGRLINFSTVHVAFRKLENDPVNYPCPLNTL